MAGPPAKPLAPRHAELEFDHYLLISIAF